VQEQVNGQWFEVESLTDVDLSVQEEQWQSYAFEPALEAANALRLQLVPTVEAGNEQGIREIEFWSPGEHEPVRSGMELRALLDQGVAVQQSRQYQAEPASGVIGLILANTRGNYIFTFFAVEDFVGIKKAISFLLGVTQSDCQPVDFIQLVGNS